jgi:hypothetical protein
MVRAMGRPIAKKAITLEDLREESLAHCEARNQAAGPWSGGVPDVLSSSRAFPKTSLRPHPSFPVCTHGRRDRRPPVDRAPGQTSETNGTHGIHGRARSVGDLEALQADLAERARTDCLQPVIVRWRHTSHEVSIRLAIAAVNADAGLRITPGHMAPWCASVEICRRCLRLALRGDSALRRRDLERRRPGSCRG